MGVIGGAKAWVGVIEDQAPKIVKLIVAAWKRTPPGHPGEREDDITNRLCLVLQRSRAARKLMFYIHPQSVELNASTGKEFGRMDIAFYPTNQTWTPREDIYFCLECKRLNAIKSGKTRSYASEYVTLGMARFVTGQYSRAVRHGCMVGYVRDGQVTQAMTNVEANIRQRRAGLRMDPPGGFVASGFLPRMKSARETLHRRSRGRPFRLHHLFMAGDPAIPLKAVVPATGKGKRKAAKRN